MDKSAVPGGVDRAAGRRRVAIIGAGPGGLCMGVRLKQAGLTDFTILEKGSGVGGTWYHNRFPGAACDVASHLYSFSFALNPAWTEAYAPQAEIRRYMERIATEQGLLPHIRFGTEVTRAAWDDDRALWSLSTAQSETIEAEVLVPALGMFNELNWPDLPGLPSFQGRVVHSAAWPDGLDVTGQRVAVIGSAASAIQLVPELAKEAERLHVFQRTASWVQPKADHVFTDEEIAAMRADPGIMDRRRQDLYDITNARITHKNPALLEAAAQSVLRSLDVVADPVTRARLTPTVPFGCQRALYSNHFYPAFNRPNVELVTEPIAKATAGGLVTVDGRERPVDLIALCTGFAANRFLSVLDVTGRNGLSLARAWADGPQAYLGIATAGFPNLFMMYGPNTNNGSIIFMLECQAGFIVRQIARLAEEGLAWLAVKPEVEAAYNDALQRDLAGVGIWQAACSGYYRSASGRIVTQWPHTMTEYAARTSRLAPEAFETGIAVATF